MLLMRCGNRKNTLLGIFSVILFTNLYKEYWKSSDGLTTSGFENLQPNTSYLFISNHRDILLDTTLLNTALFEHGLVMTASAIGDNLVKRRF
jgi:hypothetical protein